MNATAVQGGHAALGRARIIVLDEPVVETLGVDLLAVSPASVYNKCKIEPVCAISHHSRSAARLVEYLTDGELTVLSGIILTLWTCPVVSKI